LRFRFSALFHGFPTKDGNGAAMGRLPQTTLFRAISKCKNRAGTKMRVAYRTAQRGWNSQYVFPHIPIQFQHNSLRGTQMERTSRQFDAVYENGVLRPLNPVDLPEHERLSVIVNRPADPLADVLDWDAHEMAATEGDESISLEDVQAALSKIPGSMADVVSAERDER
jgi:predicted DNA-binding antitoxin AbrB/MazE fold protein